MVSFPDGVKVLHDCLDAVADICFIHGLSGDRESTWTASTASAPWPTTLLPSEINYVRIITYGYDAYVVRKGVAGSNRLIDHATNLLHDLSTDRAKCGASSRPLIFVAHSLGGIVCKQTILLSKDSPDPYLRSVYHSTIAIAFIGTPHRGSWMSYWGSISASALGLAKSTNKSLLQVLERDDQLLESIQLQFWTMVRGWDRQRPLGITCFFEELPLQGFGKVVNKDSATLEGYNSISIHANHSDMVKFATVEDTGFKRVVGELVRWVAQVVQSPQEVLPQLVDCLKSLAFLEMEDRYHGVHDAAVGTCNWLLRHPLYMDWICSKRAVLWITGKPGSGKSTILKYAIRRHKREQNTIILSFFFHGRGNELQKSSLGFFRTVLYQILSQAPEALPDLVNDFQRKKNFMGEPEVKWRWYQKELSGHCMSALSKLVEKYSVWLFVDALDECAKRDASNIVQELRYQIQSPPTSFHICFTCRHYPVQDLICEPEVCLERENSEDIATYVRRNLSTAPFFMTSSIPRLISNRADGIFLWARLVIEQVQDLRDAREPVKEIEKMVNQIPPDLDKLYCMMMEDMKSQAATLRLIQCLCVALRPLFLDELHWVMNFDDNSSYSSLRQYQESAGSNYSAKEFEKRIISLSHGLAETASSSNNTVQFVHQSVKDYFIKTGLSTLCGDVTNNDNAISMAHFRLFKTCTRYLMMEATLEDYSNTHSGTFVRYALHFWTVHLKYCQATAPFIWTDILDTAPLPPEAFVELWVKTFRLVDQHSETCPRKGTNMIHVMARYGVYSNLRLLLRNSITTPKGFDSPDESGRTPLSYAATEGHTAIVKLLLELDQVKANSKDRFGRSPLLHSARRGHESVARLLLESPKINADARDINGGTPLSWAAASGHTAVVKLLLKSRKVDAISVDSLGRTPLSYAAGGGCDIICKLFLGLGKSSADSRDNQGRTALSWAAAGNDMAIAKLALMEATDDLNEYGNLPAGWEARLTSKGRVYYVDHSSMTTTWQHPNVLLLNLKTVQADCSNNGHIAVMNLLLDRDEVDPNSEDRCGRTPLSYAASGGNVAAVRLLLGITRVDVNSSSKHFLTDIRAPRSYSPLSFLLNQSFKVARWAVNRLQITTALWPQTLLSSFRLEQKADLLSVDSMNLDPRNAAVGRTPLSYAAGNGHWHVVELLLTSTKTDVNANDELDQTPLSHAARNGHHDVVELLQECHHVIVDSKDQFHRTPFLYAAEQGHNDVVNLLIKSGKADINSQDQYGRTALSYAAEQEHNDVVNMLIKSGKANINSQDQYGRTALSYAAEQGHNDVVYLLIKSGKANINSQDQYSRTALSYAAEQGHNDMVNLLIKSGKADIALP